MNLIDIIIKKRDGLALTEHEIQYWIDQVTNQSSPDYQSAALLMAIVLNGMNSEEIANLTKSMMHSGDVIDLSLINGLTVDKHSTGGVGDKTSLVLTPLVAACGLKVAKMSGRGLGHTGGTLDKLESIEGFDIFLENHEFSNQVNKVGCALIGQTGNLVPADKALYALRDVTGTVQSIPLIASSIMSKKLAASTNCILLDVKVGDGAFMKTQSEAKELAKTMISIGKSLGRDVRAMITSMNQPLGNGIGNAIEVVEAIETLKCEGPKDFTHLCLTAASIMLVQGKKANNYDEGYRLAKNTLESGAAFEKFKEWIIAQKGNISQIENPLLLPQSQYKTEIKSISDGYISKIETEQLGHLAMLLGGGRLKKEDSINYAVGFNLKTKLNAQIQKGDTLCLVSHDQTLSNEFIQSIIHCFHITDHPQPEEPLIFEILD